MAKNKLKTVKKYIYIYPSEENSFIIVIVIIIIIIIMIIITCPQWKGKSPALSCET